MSEHNKNAFSPLKLRKHFNVVSDVAKPPLSRNTKEKLFKSGCIHRPAVLETPPQRWSRKALCGKACLLFCHGFPPKTTPPGRLMKFQVPRHPVLPGALHLVPAFLFAYNSFLCLLIHARASTLLLDASPRETSL